MLSKLANPHRFMRTSAWLMPTLGVAGVLMLVAGTYWALWQAPAEKYQGDSARIMFVHVPAAWLSMGGYVGMAIAGFTWLVWRHALADVAARAIAPLGAAFTAICLFTGSIWGKPTWGTWWEWDGRMTSVLFLLLLYIGYIALRAAMDSRETAAKASAILALVGLVNIPVIRFSVDWWNTLHQPASVIREGGPSMEWDFLGPLLWNAVGFSLLFGFLVLLAMRADVRERQAESLRLKLVTG
jgi:heme exporter protein C